MKLSTGCESRQCTSLPCEFLFKQLWWACADLARDRSSTDEHAVPLDIGFQYKNYTDSFSSRCKGFDYDDDKVKIQPLILPCRCYLVSRRKTLWWVHYNLLAIHQKVNYFSDVNTTIMEHGTNKSGKPFSMLICGNIVTDRISSST